jgi:hypothetical protein
MWAYDIDSEEYAQRLESLGGSVAGPRVTEGGSR